jgi:hypothetical protein
MTTNEKLKEATRRLKEMDDQLIKQQRDPVTYWPTAFWISSAWFSLGWMVFSITQCMSK